MFTSVPSDTCPSRGRVVCSSTTSGRIVVWKSLGANDNRAGT